MILGTVPSTLGWGRGWNAFHAPCFSNLSPMHVLDQGLITIDPDVSEHGFEPRQDHFWQSCCFSIPVRNILPWKQLQVKSTFKLNLGTHLRYEKKDKGELTVEIPEKVKVIAKCVGRNSLIVDGRGPPDKAYCRFRCHCFYCCIIFRVCCSFLYYWNVGFVSWVVLSS